MSSEVERPTATVRWWFAADDPASLVAQLDQRAADGLEGDRPVSHVSGTGRVRLGIVDPTERKVRLARRLVTKGEPWQGRSDIWFTPAGLGHDDRNKVAFLYPGVEPAAGAHTIDLPELGRGLGIEAPDVRYDTVAHQGASIFQVGLFLDATIRIAGVQPDLAAGHSVGEWAGTVATGMLPEERADAFVGGLDLEGMTMPEVDYVAISAGVERIAPIIKAFEDVVVSHDNCPGQSVICGPPESIDGAMAALRDAKILSQKLPFQSGFHTPAIEPALGIIRQMIGGLPLGPPKIPLWSATLAAPYPLVPDEIRELHLRHLVEPVRFRETIERMYHDGGARIFVQLGTGSLAAFVDDTLSGKEHVAIEALVAKRSALAQMHRAVTALWVEGLDVHPERLTTRSATPPEHADMTEQSPLPTPPGETPPAPSPATPGPVPFSLVAATDLLANAAAAGQQVLDALADRHSLTAMTAARVATNAAVETGRAASAAPAPAAAAAPPLPPPAPAPSVPPAPVRPVPAVAPPPPPPPEPPPAPLPVRGRSTPVKPIPAPRPPGEPAKDSPTPAQGRPWPTERIVITEHLSLETRPETHDHSLYPQRPGHPDPSDGFPIMAMTTQIDLLEKIARQFSGGRDLIEVFGVRALRWLDLSDPVDVTVTVVPKGDDVLSLSLGQYCRINVRFGTYAPAPRHEPIPLTNSRPTTYTPEEMFAKNIMFHGPLYQGVDEMGPTGDEGMVGTFTHLETPGSLLDNFGKLVAYWVIDKRGYLGEGALPTALGRVEYYGPEPEPGTKVRADIRIVDLKRDQVRSDGYLVLPDGRLWCRVENWTSLVFHLDELMERVYHGPADNFCVEPQPFGWNVARERWPGGTSRDMTARRYFNRGEREVYDGLPLIDQRRFLIDAIAIKDSCRMWMKYGMNFPIYPAEVWYHADGPNRWLVTGAWAYVSDPDFRLRVTTSSLEWLTVAIVSHTDEYYDIEARVVPPGADAEAIRREVHEAVAARNPGKEIESVPEPPFVVPSFLTDTVHFAVAWTKLPDDELPKIDVEPPPGS
jgi:malonyl CoA-acyl carrier protein transacylase